VLYLSIGAITVTLPASPATDDVVEMYSVAATPSFVTIDPAGANLTTNGGGTGAAPVIYPGNNFYLGLRWDGSTWRSYKESEAIFFGAASVTPFPNSVVMSGSNGIVGIKGYSNDSFLAHTVIADGVDPHPLSEVDGLMVRDESVHTVSFDALPNHRYYVSSYDNVVVTLPTDFADTDRIEIYGAGDGSGTTIIDSQGIYVAYGSGGTSDPKQFPAHGLHVSLRYNADDGSWESASDEVATRLNSDIIYSGIATSGSGPTNLEDTTATFTSIPSVAFVWFTSGASLGVVRAVTIVDNNNLTLSPTLTTALIAGDTYQLFAGVPKDRVIKTNSAGAVVTARMNLVAVATQTTSYSPVAWDLVPVDVTTSTMNINLPPSATLQNGDQIAIKVIGAATNPCNINPDNTDTIDGVTGAAALVLNTANEWAVLMYTTGGAWLQIG
jgi:hypothetical protein